MRNLINVKKNYILLLTLMITILLSSCKKDDPSLTKLNINITKQPTGGSQVNSVPINFQGIITGTVKPIVVTVEWWWENGFHSDQKLKSSTQTTFSSGHSTLKSSVWSAPSGYYLLNYFWAKISWTDDDGPHLIESSKAYCVS